MKSLKPDILWISTQDWNDVWTRKQRFAQLFARAGHRVLYVESQLHWLGYLRRRNLQKSRPFHFLRGARQIEQNLFIVTPPLVLPYQMASRMVNRINKKFIVRFLRREMNSLGMSAPIVWVYPPDTIDMIGQLDERLVIYDCTDDWPRFKRGLISEYTMQNYEQELLRVADIVFVTHEKLYRTRAQVAKNIYLVPNGVEVEHFAKAHAPDTTIPTDIAEIPRPIIGFIGTVQYWLDFELVKFLATERPIWSFVFVGPVMPYADITHLKRLPNVHFLGYRPYNLLPNYLKAFDICINPFRVDELAMSVDPLKVYEYLAAGKPVVSVDMPAVRKFGSIVRIARSRGDFLRALDIELSFVQNEEAIEQRMLEASKHSWLKRFDLIKRTLYEHLGL